MLVSENAKLTSSLVLERKLVTEDDNIYDQKKNHTLGIET